MTKKYLHITTTTLEEWDELLNNPMSLTEDNLKELKKIDENFIFLQMYLFRRDDEPVLMAEEKFNEIFSVDEYELEIEKLLSLMDDKYPYFFTFLTPISRRLDDIDAVRKFISLYPINKMAVMSVSNLIYEFDSSLTGNDLVLLKMLEHYYPHSTNYNQDVDNVALHLFLGKLDYLDEVDNLQDRVEKVFATLLSRDSLANISYKDIRKAIQDNPLANEIFSIKFITSLITHTKEECLRLFEKADMQVILSSILKMSPLNSEPQIKLYTSSIFAQGGNRGIYNKDRSLVAGFYNEVSLDSNKNPRKQ